MELFWQNNQSELRNLPIKSLPENTPFARTQHHPTATRCQTIQPLLPTSSAHSPACGQNILLLQSQEFFFLGPYQHPFTDLPPNSDFRSRLNKRACIQPAATYLRHGRYFMYGKLLCPQHILCPILYIQYPTHLTYLPTYATGYKTSRVV